MKRRPEDRPGEIKMLPLVGGFAENKDRAREIRLEKILPALEDGQDVTLDFTGVSSTTQSFIHALISDVIRKRGSAALDHLYFKGCDPTVKKIITIVTDYMQEMD